MKTTFTLARRRKEVETIAAFNRRLKHIQDNGLGVMPKGTILKDSDGKILMHKF